MPGHEVQAKVKVTEQQVRERATSGKNYSGNDRCYNSDTNRTAPDRLSLFCQRSSSVLDLDLDQNDGSPMPIRTDLSLDQSSVSSPLVIPITCSNDTGQGLNFHDNFETIRTPCPNVTSSEVTLAELRSAISSECIQSQAVYADMSGDDLIATEITIVTTDSIPATAEGILGVESTTDTSPVSAHSDNTVILLEQPCCSGSQVNFVNRSVANSRTLTNNNDIDCMHSPVLNYSPAVRRQDVRTTNSVQEQRVVTCMREEKDLNKPVKRRRKRRRPDPDEPPLSPPVTVLPPCAVCGSKSSGFHYGANTCEACKGFFRRTLKKNEVKFQCACTEDELEERRQDNGVGKNTCPACRYQQCLAVGMSRNAIKIGRYSLERKTSNICHVKTLEVEESKNGENSPPNSSDVSKSPSCSITSPVALSSDSPKDCNETTALIGCSTFSPPEKKSRFSGELTLKEIDTYVKTLYHAHKCLEEPPMAQRETIQRRQKDYFEQYNLKREMFGLRKPISKEEYFELYNSTGIEIDDRKDHIVEAVKYFEDKISKLVEFAKSIPGFRELSLQDQANLIKAARMDCSLLATVHAFLNKDFNVTTTPWGKHMHLDELGYIVNKDFILEKHKVQEKITLLELSKEEEALLTGVILTFTAARMDCAVLPDDHLFSNKDFNIVTTPWGKHKHLDELGYIVNREFVLERLKVKEQATKLDLSKEEKALLTGVILTFTAARIDCSVLPITDNFFNTDFNVATFPWGKHKHLDEIGNIVNKEFILEKYRVKEKIKECDLSQEEKALLTGVIITFTAARIECGLLSVEYVLLNEDFNVTTTPWGKHMHLDEVEYIVDKNFVLEKHKVVRKAANLALSKEEEAILTGVILTFTDRCDLIEPEKVQDIQHKLLTCLEYLIKIRPKNEPTKLGRIFNFLIAVRNVSEWEAEIIKEISLDWPSVLSIEKMESCVKVNLDDSNGMVEPHDLEENSPSLSLQR